MLIEFSVSNFRSISDRVCFSAVATSSSGKDESISFKSGNSAVPSLLKTALIIGPNASGKSSLIDAMDFFLGFISDSANTSKSEFLSLEPNELVEGYSTSDSEFEMIFSDGAEIFQYGFRLNKREVTQEWLIARKNKPRSRERLLFERGKSPRHAKINVEILGQKEIWKKSTRRNALLFSTAVQLNSKFFMRLRRYLTNDIQVIPSGGLGPHFSSNYVSADKPGRKEKFNKFVSDLDLHISGFDVTEAIMEVPDSAKKMFEDEALKELFGDLKHWKITGKHERTDGEIVDFEFSQESKGTQNLFSIAGPILDVLENGYTLVVDELNASLHPCALKGIVDMFRDKKINKKNAQLFFTSHEVSIVDDESFHKDQIWFVEKNDGFHTTLTPLSDYDVRDLRSFRKSYLNGKFGAVPFLKLV